MRLEPLFWEALARLTLAWAALRHRRVPPYLSAHANVIDRARCERCRTVTEEYVAGSRTLCLACIAAAVG